MWPVEMAYVNSRLESHGVTRGMAKQSPRKLKRSLEALEWVMESPMNARIR